MAGSGTDAPSLFEAIDSASGASRAGGVKSSAPKVAPPSDNPWATLTGEVSYMDPTMKGNMEAMYAEWSEIHRRPKAKAPSSQPQHKGTVDQYLRHGH